MSYRGLPTLYLRYINGTSGTQGEVPLPARVGPRAIPKDTIRDGGEALGQETLADISVATYSRGRVGYIVRLWCKWKHSGLQSLETYVQFVVTAPIKWHVFNREDVPFSYFIIEDKVGGNNEKLYI